MAMGLSANALGMWYIPNFLVATSSDLHYPECWVFQLVELWFRKSLGSNIWHRGQQKKDTSFFFFGFFLQKLITNQVDIPKIVLEWKIHIILERKKMYVTIAAMRKSGFVHYNWNTNLYLLDDFFLHVWGSSWHSIGFSHGGCWLLAVGCSHSCNWTQEHCNMACLQWRRNETLWFNTCSLDTGYIQNIADKILHYFPELFFHFEDILCTGQTV